MRRINLLLQILGGGAIFLLGALVGHFGNRLTTLDLKKEVQATDVFNFITTVVIAVLLSTYFQKKWTNLRTEKDLLIKDVEEVINLLKDNRAQFVQCFNKKRLTLDDVKTTKALVRSLSNGLHLLEQCAADCKRNIGDVDVNRLKSLYIEYKATLTGADFDKKVYGGETFNDEERTYGEFRSKLRLLINEINRK
jgi:hypothetical protein